MSALCFVWSAPCASLSVLHVNVQKCTLAIVPITSRSDPGKGSTRQLRRPLAECRGETDLGPEQATPARHALPGGTALASGMREGEEESTVLTRGHSAYALTRLTDLFPL